MEQVKSGKNLLSLDILSDEQVNEIHNATIEIMSKIGMVIKNKEGIKLLKNAGASVDGEHVKIPERLVKQALASTPSRITMYDRCGNEAMFLQQGNTYFGSGSDTIYTFDVETNERRPVLLKDVNNFAKTIDSLPNMSFVMSMGTPTDVPTDKAYVYEFAEMVKGSSKPIVYTAKDRNDMEQIFSIAAIAAGSEEAVREKPFTLLYAEPISPRLFNTESVQNLLFCAEKGIPFCYPPSTNTGGGGPVTMAGAIALGNAECLTGLLMAQLKNPGTPFLFGGNVAALDMKTTVVSYGSPEWMLCSGAIAQMGRSYNLPTWGTSGASDSKVVDAQAGMEAMLSVYNSLLTKNTLVHDNGYIDSGLTSSLEMVLLADEAIAMAKYLVNGITVNETTLALDAIRRVEPGKGFIADQHTFDNWDKDPYHSKRLDRNVYDNWTNKGSKDMFSRLNDEVKKILKTHNINKLNDDQEKKIEEILKK